MSEDADYCLDLHLLSGFLALRTVSLSHSLVCFLIYDLETFVLVLFLSWVLEGFKIMFESFENWPSSPGWPTAHEDDC